jgi:LAO/AO transport system kinase
VTLAHLVDAVRAGDLRAIARAISLIEDEHPRTADLIKALHPHTGRSWLVGVTGSPGAGKSTLVDRLAGHLRALGCTVGVVAVDPTSPFSGGALLGDRVRMQRHTADAGVYIRSMATRGQLGGLARATGDAALVLDAAGRDVILIETVGVGQDEVDVVRTADVSVVVLVPGAGDDVQALKAGIMEIADVYVVNKADRDGADRTAAGIDAVLGLRTYAADEWRPPVVRTEATTGAGVSDLWAAIERFRTHTAAALTERRRERAAFRVREWLAHQVMAQVEGTSGAVGLEALANAVARRDLDPVTAAGRLLAGLSGRAGAVDHAAVAVREPRAVLAFLRDALGLPITPAEDVPEQGVRVWFAGIGAGRVEVLAPLTDGSPVARFLDKRGPGLHHVALVVDDLAAVLADLTTRGVRLIDDTPRRGAGGSHIAFVHPASTGGVLVELKEKT